MGQLRIFIGVCIAAAITAATWQLMMRYEASKHRALLVAEAENTRDLVLHDLRLRLLAIDRMSARLAAVGEPDEAGFALEAASYLRDMPGFFAIGWVDLQGRLKMVEPARSKRLIGASVSEFGEDRRDVLALAARSSAFHLSPPVRLKDSTNMGFLGAKAVRQGVNQIGTLWIVFRSNEWISNLHFGKYRDDIAGMAMSIQLNGHTVFVSENFDMIDGPVVHSPPSAVAGNQAVISVKDTIPFAARTSYLIACVVTGLVGVLSISAMVAAEALRISRVQEHRAAQANAALTSTNQQMALEVEQRRKAEQDAKRSSAAKAQFLSTMSHELRTPMNGVMGMTELLRQSDLSEEQCGLTDDLGKSSAQLMMVLSDILDFSRLDSGPITLSRDSVDIRTTIDQAVKFFVPQAEKKALRLTLEVAPDVPECAMFDQNRLRQIVINLVRNAVKFTATGQVKIRITAQLDGVAQLKISVKDTGVGIPAQKLEEIFTEFQQVDGDTSRRFDGAGLGLSIVDRLAKAMGGGVEVTSQVGVGSEFVVSLPLERGPERLPVASAAPRGSAGLDGARLLVAEDNLTNQKIIASFLKHTGCQLDIANDGVEAVALFERESYDAVLMDVSMPRKNGYEATRCIRDIERQRDDLLCPIIAFTANCGEEDQRKCHEAGMNDVLAKPATKSDLLARLQSWLARGPAASPPGQAVA